MRDQQENIPIAGWFARENRETLARLIADHQIDSVTEIGSFMGLSAVWFAQRVRQVHCVDRWHEESNVPNENNLVGTLNRWELPRDFFHLFRENILRSGLWHKILPIRGNSHTVAGEVPDADLVYIDGDHSYEGCKKDIEVYLPKTRKIVCGDDYSVREGFGVIEAVTELFPQHKHCGPFWWAVIG